MTTEIMCMLKTLNFLVINGDSVLAYFELHEGVSIKCSVFADVVTCS
jgi:hypothetical protein